MQRLEEELELKTNEVVAMSEDLVNVTAENQSVNAELIDVVSSRDQAREQMGAMELRLGHAESAVMMKETEYRELLASYRCVILLYATPDARVCSWRVFLSLPAPDVRCGCFHMVQRRRGQQRTAPGGCATG